MLLKEILSSHCGSARHGDKTWLKAPSEQLCSLHSFAATTGLTALPSSPALGRSCRQGSAWLGPHQVRRPCQGPCPCSGQGKVQSKDSFGMGAGAKLQGHCGIACAGTTTQLCRHPAGRTSLPHHSGMPLLGRHAGAERGPFSWNRRLIRGQVMMPHKQWAGGKKRLRQSLRTHNFLRCMF